MIPSERFALLAEFVSLRAEVQALREGGWAVPCSMLARLRALDVVLRP